MAAVPVEIRATLYDLASKSSREVFLSGVAQVAGLGVGGGPMPGGPGSAPQPPLGIWGGPFDPPRIWGGAPPWVDASPPLPQPPHPFPEPPPEGTKPPPADSGGWGYYDGRWGYFPGPGEVSPKG